MSRVGRSRALLKSFSPPGRSLSLASTLPWRGGISALVAIATTPVGLVGETSHRVVINVTDYAVLSPDDASRAEHRTRDILAA